MTAWELDEANKNKGYASSVRYRIRMKLAGRCITEGNELAPTSSVYCLACLAKHSERVRKFNKKVREGKQ